MAEILSERHHPHLSVRRVASGTPADGSLDGLCQCPIDNEVSAGDAACYRARKEYHAGGDFLRRAHAPGRIERHRRLVAIGHAMLATLPDRGLALRVALPH